MYQSLREDWKKIEDSVIGKRSYYFLTPTSLSLMIRLEELSKRYARGRLLDVGAGRLVHKAMLSCLAESYIGLDKTKTHPKIDLLADLIKGLPFKDESFDTIFCSQVLEHLSDPRLALGEISRVLKKGGYLILSVPHLSYIHGAPEDFFRFTCYGIRVLMEWAGLSVIEIEDCGGIFSFCLTPILMMSLILGYKSSLTKKTSLILTRYLSKIAVMIDNLINPKIYALNYVAVGKK